MVKVGFELQSVFESIQDRGFLIFGEQQPQNRLLPPSIASGDIYIKVQTALLALYRVSNTATLDLNDTEYAVVSEPFIE